MLNYVFKMQNPLLCVATNSRAERERHSGKSLAATVNNHVELLPSPRSRYPAMQAPNAKAVTGSTRRVDPSTASHQQKWTIVSVGMRDRAERHLLPKTNSFQLYKSSTVIWSQRENAERIRDMMYIVFIGSTALAQHVKPMKLPELYPSGESILD